MASLRGPDGELYELTGVVLTIGRDAVNDIVLDHDPKISRSHAELRLSDGQWFLVDLGSRNGTMVNRRRISNHPLRDDDRLRLGGTTLIFVAGHDKNATDLESKVGSRVGPELSGRERQILELVAQGLTDKVIGERLFISVSTVRSHLDRIKEKTGLRRRSELTRLAIELQIVD